MTATSFQQLRDRIDDYFFGRIHQGNLIYNTCWEDPRIDRQLLALDARSEVVMITSAGCNALDYLLDGTARIHAVDLNFRQNALLELKLAFFKGASHEDLFAAFGRGRHPGFRELLGKLGPHLSPETAAFWKAKESYFTSTGRKSFFYRGGAGQIAWIISRFLLDMGKYLRNEVRALLRAGSLDEQERLFSGIEPKIWSPLATYIASKPVSMAMMGVPRQQVEMISREHPRGLAGYLKDKVRHVFTKIPTRDNYFWRVYIDGAYSTGCCPNYLRPENFPTLRARSDRVRTHTASFADFLKKNPGRYSHFVLLDHQDWLASHNPEALEEEWRLILANSRPGTRILMRSASLEVDFLPEAVRKVLRFFKEKAAALHVLDRVGTYGSLHFAEVA